MPRSALPKNYVIGPDNQSWLMRQKKKVQILLAAGPRVPSGFFKWRDIPRLLFLFKGKGPIRTENTDGTKVCIIAAESELEKYWKYWLNCSCNSEEKMYASRIQPWSRWGIVLQWPLFFNCWFIYRKEDVVSPPRYKSSFGIGKMFTFGIGFKRDADKVYWITANIGGNFE